MQKIAGIIVLVLTMVVAPLHAQQRLIVSAAYVEDGDTILYSTLREVQVSPYTSLLTQQEIKKNQKLIRNVKKMLPYAQTGKRELDALEAQLASLPKKKQKEIIKAKEKEMLDRYTEELKKCTISQGMVLLKLIDRETGKTSYTIVNELRGKLRAGFYQTFARLFGYNLKAGFDPQHSKQDDLIDRICIMVENGRL
ncbi:MAG: DUF4294 domain-containing protein [Bacteroidales bacterium]|nr:DUF4294 domain-containing protein [Bacteroidales bacterium]